MKNLALLLICTLLTFQAAGQTIFFENSSFESMPRPGKAPDGWYNCGFKGETPPDVQPDPTFSVTTRAFHGGTYLGMVVRDNDTWESVSQKLKLPLNPKRCYSFSLMLARSQMYISVSRTKDETANYNTPAILKIWGGDAHCEKGELLAVTEPISNTAWEKYEFILQPEEAWSSITFEAYFHESQGWLYNGNLLIDHASGLTPIDCQTKNGDSEYPEISNIIIPPVQKPVIKKHTAEFDISDNYSPEAPSTIEEMEQRITNNLPLVEFEGGRVLTFENQNLAQIALAIKSFPKKLFILSVKNDEDHAKVNLLRVVFENYGISNDLLIIRAANSADDEREWLVDDTGNGLRMRYVAK